MSNPLKKYKLVNPTRKVINYDKLLLFYLFGGLVYVQKIAIKQEHIKTKCLA